MPKTDLILVKELENGDGYKTGFIILNSPDTLNSLTLDMVKTISDQLRNWSNDPYLAAVSIEGAGEKAFCAGGDIRALYESMLRNPGGPNPFSEEFFLPFLFGHRLCIYMTIIITNLRILFKLPCYQQYTRISLKFHSLLRHRSRKQPR